MNAIDVVFNIQRFSLHDGPGIRTTVFLKGCTMQCFWCHNPEGQHPAPELRYFPDRCIACGDCVAACPKHAHELKDGVHLFHRDQCNVSGNCVETCFSRALQLEGQRMSVQEVMDEILTDKPFYDSSGGGITLSGGEPSLSHEFAQEILRRCKNSGLHTAIETCGDCTWSSLEALLPFSDLIMMDLKHIDPVRHKEATRQSNERILDNARRLAVTDKPIVFRTPIVPTVNDSAAEIEAIASFIHALLELRKKNGHADGKESTITYEILPFHKLASGKYLSLGLEYKAAAIDPPSKEKLTELAEAARRKGVEIRVR
jgi:pyruvate formate lyase activating enzyme